ncbi:hypothetical protein ACET3Z_021033 [Daucus carota]
MDIAGEWSVKEAEARNLREAISWSMELGFKRCIFELDSKSVVDACFHEWQGNAPEFISDVLNFDLS